MYTLSTRRMQRCAFLGLGCCISSNNLFTILSVRREILVYLSTGYLEAHFTEPDELRIGSKLSAVGWVYIEFTWCCIGFVSQQKLIENLIYPKML